MERSWIVIHFVVGLAVIAWAGPQSPLPALDYRAQRDFQSLRETLVKRAEQEFVEQLHTFVKRYGYVPALAKLYMEWAEKQTTIKRAAEVYAEILDRWPEQPEAQEAVRSLSEIMLLTEPWSLDRQLTALRGFSQRLTRAAGETRNASLFAAMAKVFLAVNEPNQGHACIAAALSRSQDKQNIELHMLQAEAYRTAGNSVKAAEMFEQLLEQPLSTRQKQAAASGLLDCISPMDPRFDPAAEELRDADLDNLTSQSLR